MQIGYSPVNRIFGVYRRPGNNRKITRCLVLRTPSNPAANRNPYDRWLIGPYVEYISPDTSSTRGEFFAHRMPGIRIHLWNSHQKVDNLIGGEFEALNKWRNSGKKSCVIPGYHRPGHRHEMTPPCPACCMFMLCNRLRNYHQCAHFGFVRLLFQISGPAVSFIFILFSAHAGLQQFPPGPFQFRFEPSFF